MMRTTTRSFSILATLAVVLTFSGCSAVPQPVPNVELGEVAESSTEASPAPTDGPESSNDSGTDPDDVPEDDTDYSVDAGQDLKEYEYPDDPMPAEATVDTLCNLNREYLSGLRTIEDSVPVPDDRLRTSLVGFSDLLEEWDVLRIHFPTQEADFDRAREIFQAWDRAILSEENGDFDAARSAMADAEKLLNELPASAAPECSSGY